MKLALFVILSVLLSSCTHEKQKPVPVLKPIPKFMSQVEVKEAFAVSFGQKVAKDESLTQEAQNRFSSIIPKNTFFTPKQLSRKKTKKSEYAAKGSADLREFDSPVENQWNGTCTAHGLRNVVDNKGRTEVSTRHIWNEYKIYSCEAAINAWLDKGCITNNGLWPHDSAKPLNAYLNPNNCNTYLSEATYIDDDLDKMKKSLDNGNPVYLGITVTNSLLNCDKTLAPTSKATTGGHALAIMGYKDDANIKGGGYFIIKNSWGADCGDHGYQYVPYQYCKRKDMYCVMWSISGVQTSKDIEPIVPTEEECVKYKRLWYAPWKSVCTEWAAKIDVLEAD